MNTSIFIPLHLRNLLVTSRKWRAKKEGVRRWERVYVLMLIASSEMNQSEINCVQTGKNNEKQQEDEQTDE